MRYPSMQHTVTWFSDDEFCVEIVHHVAQSYSRSVKPKATRVAKQSLFGCGGTWELYEARYGDESDPESRTWTSVFSYRKVTAA